MFTDNMGTEAIPARVYALYKIVASEKEISKDKIRSMMEPPGIHEGTSYFPSILNAARELQIIDEQNDVIVPIVPKKDMKSINDFRKYVISKLNTFENKQFFQVTNIIVNMNEDTYQHSLTSADFLNIISEKYDSQLTAPMMRGWRFWAQFLGIGYIYKMFFLPNAYIFVKNVLDLMQLEKNKSYEIDDFMLLFETYGKIISDNLQPERHMNIALSSALRELHDNGEIELKYRSDAEKRWILYPSSELFNEQIASVVYKGVKK